MATQATQIPQPVQQDPWGVAENVVTGPYSKPVDAAQQDPWGAAEVTPNAPVIPPADAYGSGGYAVIANALKKAVYGPDTALAQGPTPDQGQEALGFSDIAHGDIRKGLSEIWKGNAPHVIPGSPLEKEIQQYNPNFHGMASEEYQAAYPTISSIGDHPLVDAGQFIDKKEHPILKATVEAAQSLTSPNNVAIMIGTGGMGLVKSPKALAVANKLLSAGFSAGAIGSAYKHSEDFMKAYDSGDAVEAQYQLTHAVLSGAMSYVAGLHATGNEMPFASATDRAVANKITGAIGGVGSKISAGTSAVANAVAGQFGISNDFNTVVKNISKPGAKGYTAYKAKIANVSDDLQSILNNSPKPIEDPKGFADAVDSHIQNHEQALQKEAGATTDSSVPVAPNLMRDLSERLDKFFAANKGKFPDEAVPEAKKKLLERVLQSRNGEHLLEPNLFEAENVRRGLNDEAQPGLGVKRNAYQAGALELADELRSKIDEGYEKRGVKGVQEWRSKEKDLIDVRDQIGKAQKRAEDLGEPSLWKSVTDKVGLPSAILSMAFGLVHPAGAAMGAAGILGHYLSDKGTNPNFNVQRAADIAGKNLGATATEPERVPTANVNPNPPNVPPAFSAGGGTIGPSTGSAPAALATAAPVPPVPVNHAFYADLAAHYGETLGKTHYDDLEGRFLVDMTEKQKQGIPLQPAEKTLLTKYNQHLAKQQVAGETAAQEAAQKLAEAQQKAAEEAEAKKKEDAAAGLVTVTHPPFETTDHLPVPARFAEMGYTPQRVGMHELAHQIMVDEHGHGTGDIINHHHDMIDDGSLAEARWEKPNFMDEDGKVKVDKIPEILEILHAGVVAEELAHGVPLHENPADDLEIARKIVKDAGFTPAEAGMIMKAAEMKARELFTSPGVLDIMKRYTEHREAGLDKDTHMSAETVGKAVQEVRHARGGGNAETNIEARPGEAGKEVAPGNEAGGKGATKGEPKEAVRTAGEGGTAARGAGEGTNEGVNRTNLKPRQGNEFANRTEGGGGGPTVGELNPEAVEYERQAKEREEGEEPEMERLRRLGGAGGGEEGPEEHFLTEELQHALPQPHEVAITKPGGEEVTETIPALSTKKALAAAVKKYPGSEATIVQTLPRPEPIGPYVAPTGKLGKFPESQGRKLPLETIHHELGHFFVGNAAGMESEGMLSHTHPDVRGSHGRAYITRAAVKWDLKANDLLDENGRFTPEKLGDKLPKLIEMFMGGIAADEALNNVPRDTNDNNNPKFPGDRGRVESILRRMGKTPEEVTQIANTAIDLAKTKLQHPVTRAMIDENAPFREKGLSSQYHYSDERFKQMAAEHARRMQEYEANNGPNATEAGVGRENVVAGAEGQGQPVNRPALQEVNRPRANADEYQRRATAALTPETARTVPPERSTGNPEHDAAIKAGGGVPGGVSDFGEFGKIHNFHDPQTGSTLGIRNEKDITPENVRAQIEKSRAAFAAGKAEPFKTNLRPDRVSTRVPTAKATAKFTPEDHMGEEPLTIGRKAVDMDPRIQQKLADVVSKYPGFKFKKGMNAAQILDSFTTQAKDNLLHLWDSVEPAKRTQNAKWYESVNKKAHDDAAANNIEPRQAAGVYASLSPQKDWDMNASLAKRVQDVHFNHGEETGTPKMTQFGQGLVDKARADAEKKMAAFKVSGEKDPVVIKRKQGAYDRKLKNADNLEGVVNKVAGQKYSDLTDPYEKGVWIRLYDEVNNPRNYPKIDPGTGNPLEDVTNQDGSKSSVAWGSMEPIARAASILQDGSRANISEQLGGEHKVRNFYNNIIDPTHPDDVTIDTHAVAAAHMQPFSGQSKEVGNNFGGAGKSAQSGVHGSYPLYAEAYRQAAAERGVKAREMQSVTWEKIRELFPSEIKDADFQKEAKGIMKKVSDGKISIKEARQQVTDAAVEKRAGQTAKTPKKTLDITPKIGDNATNAGIQAMKGAK
jgi:hypothetical protein